MKEKFEKVVEWEKKPSWFSIILGIICLVSSFLLGLTVISIHTLVSASNINIIELSILFLIVVGDFLIIEGFGGNRKVYWEEVK